MALLWASHAVGLMGSANWGPSESEGLMSWAEAIDTCSMEAVGDLREPSLYSAVQLDFTLLRSTI